MVKVFIDGKAGTTGLRIYERLEERSDILLLTLSEEERKNPVSRKKMLNECDVAFLCLPDKAAEEAADFVENDKTVIIDTSTFHRTMPGWAYGFPELSPEFEEKVRNSKRISVPGCHASGFISLIYPLVREGVIDKSQLLSCHSITGYSGGGKSMIAQYESEEKPNELFSPRQYGLTQTHKHLKEMQKITGLENAPVFSPIVSDFYSGMVVTVPIFRSQLLNGKDISDIKETYKKYYSGDIVKYKEVFDEEGFICSNALSMKDSMEVSVYGNDDRILLVSRYDNLGKGASGAAVECFNIVTGQEKTKGLVI